MATQKTKSLYFTANPNGEAELVTVTLSPACKSPHSKVFDYGFSDLEIKGAWRRRQYRFSRYPVKKVVLKEAGHSTIGALKVWMDEVSGRLNTENRGRFLGEFDTGEAILAIYKDGTYELNYVEMSRRYDPKDLMFIRKFDPDAAISAVHLDGNKGWTMVKRFLIETTSVDQRYSFISDHRSSKLYFASTSENPVVKYSYKAKNEKQELELDLAEFIDVKGWRALGNKLGEFKVLKIGEMRGTETSAASPKKKGSLTAGDTVDFDLGGQGSLF